MDWEAEGLLDGLSDDAARDARRRLLDELWADGAAVRELRLAVAEERLVLLPLERELAGAPRYTAAEVAGLAGVEVRFVLDIRRALGLPIAGEDEHDFTDVDVDWVRQCLILRVAGVPDEDALEVLRVLGDGMARYVDAMTRLVGQAFLRPNVDEDELAERYAAAARQLLPSAGAWLERVMTMHMREHVRAEVVSAEERRAGRLTNTSDAAVAFVDIVGFTALGEHVPVEDLGTVAGGLTRLAGEAATGSVRLVKVIGDGAMLVSPEPAELVEAVLAMLERAEGQDDFPALRGGIAYGPAVNRWGDWYGTTVNLASRLCTRARPASVLADESTHAAVDGRFDWSFAGEKKLKGLSAPVSAWRVRRPAG
jgi:adenylate cyclase